MQCTARRDCAFCDDPAHFMGSCPLIDGYIQAGKASRGTDSRLYLPDGRHIPHVQGTRCLRECLDCLPAPTAATQPNLVVTARIFSVSSVETHMSLCLYSTPFTFHPTALLLSLHSELLFSC